MKMSLKRIVPFFCIGLFISSGCSKRTVKTEPAPAPSLSSSSQKLPAQPEPAAGIRQEPAGAASAGISGVEASPAPQPVQSPSSADLGKELEKIFFDFDSATLSDAARQTLAANFEMLKLNADLKVRIEGHCDERGSDEYNLALSERRARAAASYLTALGVPRERLSIIGFGEEKPAEPGQNQAAWSKNRRDEFAIIK